VLWGISKLKVKGVEYLEKQVVDPVSSKQIYDKEFCMPWSHSKLQENRGFKPADIFKSFFYTDS
jgi:hypothetical protein